MAYPSGKAGPHPLSGKNFQFHQGAFMTMIRYVIPTIVSGYDDLLGLALRKGRFSIKSKIFPNTNPNFSNFLK